MSENLREKIKYYTELVKLVLLVTVATIGGTVSIVISDRSYEIKAVFGVLGGFCALGFFIVLIMLNISIIGKLKKI